jgi:hypothetical protein
VEVLTEPNKKELSKYEKRNRKMPTTAIIAPIATG